jgi:hypothetical protein
VIEEAAADAEQLAIEEAAADARKQLLMQSRW